MAQTDIKQTTTTDMTGTVPDFAVSSKLPDMPSVAGETYWDSPYWSKWNGYDESIPELHQSIRSLTRWTVGKGWTADVHTTNRLKLISGRGGESFQEVMENAQNVKKINGDSFTEVIFHNNDITTRWFNLKPLNPSSIRVVMNQKGIIIHYEELDGKGGVVRELNKKQVLHLCNDRKANSTHGTSVIESCEKVILARNEAMADWRRILHRSTIRVLYADVDKPAELVTLKTQYAEAIKNGEVLVLPGKPGDTNLNDWPVPPSAPFMDTIRYYENFFYQAVGVPKVILGGAQEYTEAASKVGYLTFEQVYMAEQRILEDDLQKQLGIEVTFERPVSLKEPVQEAEAANTGQVGIQPNEVTAQVGRTE